ncbi:2-hydroxyacyl-CoA dehydratase family protein [bacterium]|nr:2-hydroxyacyl-CoA dehydratase family protein [bacterium]
MRPEIKEYNYDWMLGSLLKVASEIGNSSEKEIQYLTNYIPYFKGTLSVLLREGEVGTCFIRLLDKYFDNILTAHQNSKKISAITFCLSPALFHAMNIVPVTLEVMTGLAGLLWKRGAYDYLDYGCELGFTETSCSSQRGALGAYLAGLGEEIDFLVCDTPGVCDTNANAFAFASTFMEKPFFQLNYPQTIGDEKTRKYHLDDYKDLITFLKEQTGKDLDVDRLREVLKEVDKQDDILAEIEDFYCLVPNPIPVIFNLFIYIGRFISAGLPEYTELLELMLEKVQQNAQKGITGLHFEQEKARVFMCYIDHYTLNLDFFDWLNRRGISHLGGILSRNFRDNTRYASELEKSTYGIDTSTFETMLTSLSEMNATLPMVRSIRGPFDKPNMWLEESISLARLYHADCVVYNGTPGCRNTWGMVKPFAREVEKAGFPVHIMNGDAFDDRVESWESTVNRLEEFLSIRGLL